MTKNEKKLEADIEELYDKIKIVRDELDVAYKLLKEHNRLMNAIPECPVHGNRCVPHAIEWILRVKTLGQIIFRENKE